LRVEGFGYGGQNVMRIVTRPMLGEFDSTTSVVNTHEEVISPTVGEAPIEFGRLAVLAATEFFEASIKQLTCEHAFSRPVFSGHGILHSLGRFGWVGHLSPVIG
jgi:hypothetical protein